MSKKLYVAVHPFQLSEDGSMVYNLIETGSYKKGQVELANDITIQISQRSLGRNLDPKVLTEVLTVIRDALNKEYPVKESPDGNDKS
jgi:hypothetical protein